MKRKSIHLTIIAFSLLGLNEVKAQVYTPKVSKDSLGILKGRVEALKASQKVQELKIEEAQEEVEVEKLRVKLLAANDKAKESAEKNSKNSQGMDNGTVNLKDAEKLAKKAKSDMTDAQKALERYNKQIQRVEKKREEIAKEEKKLTYKKPVLEFKY